MLPHSRLVSLPTSLLFLILSSSILPTISAEPQWPHNQYSPDEAHLIKRGLESLKKLEVQKPIAVRKMSTDPNEMFFLDYWEFDDTDSDTAECTLDDKPYTPGANESTSYLLELPVLLHSSNLPEALLRHFNPLVKRDFVCPTGYSTCAANSNLCCPSGQTCVSIQDTGSGSMGCCPSGVACQTGALGCNSNAGYSTCPGASNGGGCCIPNYTCFGLGCRLPPSSTFSR
jgi:progranulin